MSTFVLVPGYWLGAWAWRRVVDKLEAQGHRVFPATLTGLAEREHLAGPDVTLDTHVLDVVNLVRFEALEEVVLVGHSYGGVVVTCVADRVPEKLKSLVYVDSGPMPNGMAQADFYPPELRQKYERIVNEQGDGWRLPLGEWSEMEQGNLLDGLTPALRQEFRARATPMPFNAARQPVKLGIPALKRIPKTAVWCTVTTSQVKEMIASGNPMFASLAGSEWRFIDLPTGHWPMFSKPEYLARILAEQ